MSASQLFDLLLELGGDLVTLVGEEFDPVVLDRVVGCGDHGPRARPFGRNTAIAPDRYVRARAAPMGHAEGATEADRRCSRIESRRTIERDPTNQDRVSGS